MAHAEAFLGRRTERSSVCYLGRAGVLLAANEERPAEVRMGLEHRTARCGLAVDQRYNAYFELILLMIQAHGYLGTTESNATVMQS